MNTPSHLILNLALLGKQQQDASKYLLPVLIGALLPDLPMFIFYFVERVIFDTPSQIIWRESYFEEGWQNFIDCFNSIPFIAVALGLAWKFKQQFIVFICLSMLLHIACDLPVHHDDGHRHFFPFLQWRFESPISYWDPRHYGQIFSWLEALLVFSCCGVMLIRHKEKCCRIAVGALILLQIADLSRAVNYFYL